IEKITSGQVFLRILSNLTDRALVRASATIGVDSLASNGYSGEQVRDGIVLANAFARTDPYRATTHNKGIMNGVDAVAIASGNDWRAIEAAAHAYAARSGRYQALTRWYVNDIGNLVGELTLPLKVGTVGGQVQSNQAVLLAHRLMGIESAAELAQIMTAVGLAQNLAALKALSTEGIQRGHMTLHARSVAIASGATEDQFEDVVERLIAAGDIKVWKAREILAELATEETTQPASRGDSALQAEQPRPASASASDQGYGKIILLGEHSVVYGHRAVAAAIPLSIHASIQRQPQAVDLLIPRWGVEMTLGEAGGKPSSLERSLALIIERLGVAGRGMQIEVSPHVPRANGLGASAALAVAVIRAMARCFEVTISEQEICKLAYDCEKIAHGTPSGIDNTLATFGQPILYNKAGVAPRIRELQLARSIPVVIGLSGVQTLTAQTVADIRAAWQRNPQRYESIFTQIDGLAQAGAQALEQGELEELGDLMNIDQGLLNALQVSSWEIEELVQIARRNGALGAKLTGGGGGGAMIAIAEEQRTEGIANAMRRAGYRTFVTEIR